MKKTTELLITAVLSLVTFALLIYDDQHPKLNTTEVINIYNNSSNVTFSEPMSFSKMVTHYAEASEMSYDEALKLFPKENTDDTVSSKCYRILNIPLDVTAIYKPQLNLYCETSESGHYWGISNIYLANMEKITPALLNSFPVLWICGLEMDINLNTLLMEIFISMVQWLYLMVQI